MSNDRAKTPSRKKPPAKPKVTGKILEAKEHEGERIAKVMARAGLCSRRDAEEWIAAGRVAVNGQTLVSAALNVTEDDKIAVDGKPLATRERTRLFLFHKPRGLVTTDRDPEGRATVFDYIAEHNPALPRLMSIGQLDINTEGLLLLTNDGGLARTLELPATGWLRRYRARANGHTDQTKLDTLKKGVTLEGVDYAGVDAKLDRVQGANVWISLGLREGKNREVKKLLEHLGLGVNRLIRLSYGPFQLGEMAEGTVEEVRTRVLVEQLGEKLAAESGADFDGPVIDRTPEPEPEEIRAPRGGDKIRPHRAGPDAPRPAPKKPEPRKHVSALRDDRVKAEKGPRRRVEKGETADRKGRAVTVERVSIARKPEISPDNRNARRFRAEREGAEARPERFEGERKPRGRAEGKPDFAGDFKRDFKGERGPKRSGPPRGEAGAAKSFAPKTFRGEPQGGKPAGRSEKPFGRNEKPAGRSERPFGRSERPAGKGEGPSGRSEKPSRRGDRPQNRGAPKPFGGGGGKPPGRGGRPSRPKA